MTELSIEQRVENGIKAHDTDLGVGWVYDIDIERLDISHPNNCIRGQLVKIHTLQPIHTWREAGLLGRWPTELPLREQRAAYEEDCAALTVEWGRRIRDLQKERAHDHGYTKIG